MPDTEKVATAIGEPLERAGKGVHARLAVGTPPVVFQVQNFGFIPLEKPEELKQWEDDLRNYYGLNVDASALAGRACETCSCCTDDSGLMA
jgi:hypothetical protein